MHSIGIAFLEVQETEYLAHVLLPGWEQPKIFHTHTGDEEKAKRAIRKMSHWFIGFETRKNVFNRKVETLTASSQQVREVRPVPARKSGSSILPPSPEVIESIPGMLSRLNIAVQESESYDNESIIEEFNRHIDFYLTWFRRNHVELVQLSTGLYDLKRNSQMPQREEYTDYREQITQRERETVRFNSRGSKSPLKW